MKIGVDYYPEHWDKKMWNEDAELMRTTGVKIVRLAEFAWCRLEPFEGEYDFDWLDEAIEIFEKNDIKVVLGTPTNTPPLWLFDKYPDAIQVNKNGNRSFIGIRGHRCYNSPSFRKLAGNVIEKMTKHYANNESVIGWQIDNELEANHCCCDVCTGEFRNWLKNKYDTLENMNACHGNVVWSGEYTRWEQITGPLGDSLHLNPSYLQDFNRYASDSMVKYIRFQNEIIRKNCPSHFVTTNTWFTHNLPDFYDAFEELDFVSYDNYPTTKVIEDQEELHTHAFHCDMMRGIKRKNFWIMEQLSGTPGCWMPMMRTPKPGMIKGYSFQAMARGADNIIHFRWRNASIGAEMFWHGLIDHSNVPGRRFFEFKELCDDVNSISQELTDSVISNQVAILYSSEQEYAFKIQPQVEGMYYLEQLQLFHKSLLSLGVGSDIINWSENLQGYKVVIAPTLYICDEKVTKNIYEFVEAGGTLILTSRTGVKDINNHCVMEELPGVFKKCAGIVVEEYDPIGSCNHLVKDQEGKSYLCREWCDIIKTVSAKVVATYADDFFAGKPAVTVNEYGLGSVYYLGTVFQSDFYNDLLKRILIETGIDYYDDLETGIELSMRHSESSKYLFVFNNSNEEKNFQAKEMGASILKSMEKSKSIKLQPYGYDILKF